MKITLRLSTLEARENPSTVLPTDPTVLDASTIVPAQTATTTPDVTVLAAPDDFVGPPLPPSMIVGPPLPPPIFLPPLLMPGLPTPVIVINPILGPIPPGVPSGGY